MFIIPCKYNNKCSFIIQLVDDIRRYHPTETIVVIDSDSENKSYFDKISRYNNLIIEDIKNKNWAIGAFWYAYKKYRTESFYYFLHDSMRIKSNLDYMKDLDLTLLMTFDRTNLFDSWGELINQTTKYNYIYNGKGCYGPIFMCKNKVMKRMLDMGADKIIPNSKQEIGYCEGCYGFFLEEQGYDLNECSLYGDVLFHESEHGKSGRPPFNTSWQFPIEKFYGSIVDNYRIT